MTEPAGWRRYSRLDKESTAPPVNELVWVHEFFYEQGNTSIGAFDGFTFRIPARNWTDDCHVTHWMPVTRPAPPDPAEVKTWDEEVDAAEQAAHPEWFRKT